MTGYGRAEYNRDGLRITVELKSTNHRYSEVVMRSPRELAPLEERAKRVLLENLRRGRLEVSVNYQNQMPGLYGIRVNTELAIAYQKGLEKLAQATGVSNDLRLVELAELPDVLVVERQEVDLELIWVGLEQALREALFNFNSMRSNEGVNLHQDIKMRLMFLAALTRKVASLAPQSEELYRERLEEKMIDYLQKTEYDQNRLMQEVALWSDKTSISEELIRLESHASQFEDLLNNTEEAVGRKADFLLQEMNREVNTIGSKANDLSISQIVIDMKAELEKIREQVQNVE